jgi:glutaredoxin
LTPLNASLDTTRMQTLIRRFRRPITPLTVTLYTRRGCHLCDDAKKPVSRAVAATAGAIMHTVDIAGDEELEARYGTRIPVVTVSHGGAESVVAEGKISDIRLRRAFRALTAGE